MIATHRRRIELLAVATSAVVLVAIGTVAVLWSVRDRPGPRSLEDALAEFREGDSSAIESIGAVVGRPSPGVYTATGSGRTSIDFPPTSQSYGATIPVIVRTDGDDCWTTEVDFNVAFRQTWEYCIVDGEVFEHANRTSTRWDLGVATIDYWYAIDSFLLVRMHRSIGLRTASPVGTVTYSETGSWQLQSLEAKR